MRARETLMACAIALAAQPCTAAAVRASPEDAMLRKLEAKLEEVERRVQSLEETRRALEAERQELRAERDQLRAREDALADAEEALPQEHAPPATAEADAPETSDERVPRVAAWLDRFRLSGNADLVYWNGEHRSFADSGQFSVENARMFLDVDIAQDLRVRDHVVADAASFYIEWDMFRWGEFKNKIGSLYGRFDGLFGLAPLNLKFGQMPIVFGEEYVRFSEGRPDNPLITFSAANPYNWDQGAMLFGANQRRSLEYVIQVMNGEAGEPINGDVQVSGKLTARPRPWAQVSLSGLHTGELGDGENPAKAALKFSGTFIVPFGSGTSVPNFQNGRAIPDDPDLKLDTMNAAEVDVVLSNGTWGRLWLGYGWLGIRSAGSSTYDRNLQYGVAEGVLELGALARMLDPLYLASRYSFMGTFDSDEGYRLGAMDDGDDLGFNTENLSIVSLGLGLRLGQSIVLKSEYAWYDFDLVRGTSAELRRQARDRDFFGIDLSYRF